MVVVYRSKRHNSFSFKVIVVKLNFEQFLLSFRKRFFKFVQVKVVVLFVATFVKTRSS